MKVIEFLNKSFKESFTVHDKTEIKTNIEMALESLKEAYGIKAKLYWCEGIVVLNYDQIDCPKGKGDPLVRECRSLVLYLPSPLEKTFSVCSRSFDRFFNIGEDTCDLLEKDITNCVAHEKLDGSLVTLYHITGVGWVWRTKSQAFSEAQINNMGITFNHLITTAASSELLAATKNGLLSTELSYIFEVTSPLNRVVVNYETPELTILAIRNNDSGNYLHSRSISAFSDAFKVNVPKSFTFESLESILHAVKHLPNLEEGYVLYKGGIPVAKCKSPAYVAAHHIKGEGLNPKRICELILEGELSEYYSVFPSDKEHIQPYVDGYNKVLTDCKETFNELNSRYRNPKDFALQAMKYPYSPLLFKMRTGHSLKEALDKMTTKSKMQLIILFKDLI